MSESHRYRSNRLFFVCDFRGAYYHQTFTFASYDMLLFVQAQLSAQRRHKVICRFSLFEESVAR